MYNLISLYARDIISLIIMVLVGACGTICTIVLTRYFDTDTKRQVAVIVVRAVEQIYQELNGPEKLAKAMEQMSQLLAQKHVSVSPEEMRAMIEAAVSEYNSRRKRD